MVNSEYFGWALAATLLVSLGAAAVDAAEAGSAGDGAAGKSRLAVVWTSGDPDVAHRVCLMYTHAAAGSGWFDEVRLIVWGPSARLLAADKDLQTKLKAMQKDGVILQACIACADSYGVTPALRQLGIEVKGMGKPLTDLLKSDCKVITF